MSALINYKLISINAVTVSYRRSTWIRYQKKISWSEIKYKCITKNIRSIQYYVTTRTEQVQDKKNINWAAKKYYNIKASYVSILQLPSFYLYMLQTIWLLHLYYIIQMFVYLYIQHSLTSICYTLNFLYRWILSV